MKISAVVITRGDRPSEFDAAIVSLELLEPPINELVVVWNGTQRRQIATKLPVTHVDNDENVGVTRGRNQGALAATGDLVFFLDDDARVVSSDLVLEAKSTFQRDGVSAVGFAIEDPVTGERLKRWLPRPRRSISSGGPATRFPGGACMVRRVDFVEQGGFPEDFFFGHEETDLSWRLIDSGKQVLFSPRVVVAHPATARGRSAAQVQAGMRNRVWLAKRRLPHPLSFIYTVNWLAASLARSRSPSELRANLAGARDGITTMSGERRPMSWSTVIHLTRMGHPPLF